jgi:Asp-tRNA(Asn)/Glu-tRNA(Gln) amidotransferase A subunit family amidase
MREAKVKDAQTKEAIQQGTAHLLPPLHGIPISIKDLVRVLK